MRILTVGNMYPPYHLGGYELVWRSAVAHLRTRGHEVRVLTTDYRSPPPDPSLGEDPDVHRQLRWYWRDHEFPRLRLAERVRLERHNAQVLRRHLKDLRADAVCWWAMGGMSLGLIEQVRRRGVPSLGIVHDDWMNYGPAVDGWMRLFVGHRRAVAPLADLLLGLPANVDLSASPWLFNSHVLRGHALNGGWALPLSEVVHPGIDPALFAEEPAHEWDWRLLYVGRIDERKGIDMAIEALPLLPEVATLRVLGSGDEAHLAALRALAGRLGVDGRVAFAVRSRQELRWEYAAADVLVFPVRWEEPWGLVPLEAMAVGAPVVATGRGGSGEYLRHEENSLLFDSQAGAEDLARALRRLAETPGLRARLRDGGLRTAGRYTEGTFNQAVEAALSRLPAR